MQKLQCELCGGNLVMDDSGDFAVCENCGMKFKKETVKKMIVELSGVVQVDGISNLDNLLKRAFGFLEDGDWKQADEYFEKILDLQPESAQAYLGKMMVDIKCRGVNDTALTQAPIESNPNFQKALRCADEAYRATLLGYAAASRENYRAQLKNITKGGLVLFGSFQSAYINWRVLAVSNARALLLSEKCLVNMPFDKGGKTNQWKDCSLRCWLNGEFYEKAFSEDDKAMISPYNVAEAPEKAETPPAAPQPVQKRGMFATLFGSVGEAPAAPVSPAPSPVTPVLDNVFLLSIDEAEQYFANNYARKAVEINDSPAGWWLRTPGSDQSSACLVCTDGDVYGDNSVSHPNLGVRPALWLNL